MEPISSFGYWLRRRRRALDLTQDDLARQVGCAIGTIKKIETDERHPSKQLAERLADYLEIPTAERAAFLKAARAELAVDQLAPPTRAVSQSALVPTAALPHGTVTFLFTDIEGSTQLWTQHPQAMPAALARHETVLRAAINLHGGVVFKTVGDAVCAAFASALDALQAALAAQRALATESWALPLRVRMALHTGVVVAHAGDYQGLPLSRVARLIAAGHGGQILLSAVTQELVRDDLPADTALHDLGVHRLKDLARPEPIFQLVAPDLPADFPPLRTLGRHRHNLPVQPTVLIGREQEIAGVLQLLQRPELRLVTLTGPGGTGKTRLALQIAAELLDTFADGVWLVNLAPISDPDLVLSAIGQSLGLKETGGQSIRDLVHDYLREKQTLLLLDNCEQVLAAAPLIAELLAMAPQITVLATSREVLHLRGEQEFAVPPLGLPDHRHPAPLERFGQYEAVRLFIERAQAVKADFTVTNDNAPAVAEICVRLDGLPLAIELAAARIKLFPPQALLSRLDQRLTFLTGGARDLPARQQTLRNTIDWSYDLLDAGEQQLFRRLSVFVGGCTLDAITAICPAESEPPRDVLDIMTALLDQNLLRQNEGPDGEPRFVLLETVCEYALERLAASDEAEALRRQHAASYLALAEAAEPELHRAPQKAWWNQLEVEHDNLRAALAWALEDGAVEIGLRGAGALWWFWYLRGYWSEGRGWLARALACTDRHAHPVVRAKGLFGAAMLAAVQGDYATARPLSEESLAISRVLADRAGCARALVSLAWVELGASDFAAARALLEESLILFRELGDAWYQAFTLVFLSGMLTDQHDFAAARVLGEESLALFRELGDSWGQAQALSHLGQITLFLGNYDQAAMFIEESLVLARDLENKQLSAGALDQLAGIARAQGDYVRMRMLGEESVALRELGDKEGLSWALYFLGIAAQRQGDARRATTLLAETLALFQETGNVLGPATYLEGMAGVAALQGQPAHAVRLHGAAAARREALGMPPMLDERRYYDQQLAEARDLLGTATFEAAWAEGQAMTVEQGIAYARSAGD
jgi:predicted ATPase/class 3 adenylate cyclase